MIDKDLKKLITDLAKENQKTAAAQQKTELAQQKTELAQQKTEASLREIRKELAEERKKTDESQRQIQKDLAEERKKTEASQRQLRKASQRQLRKDLGGVGHTQGEIAEDLFWRNFKALMRKQKIVLKEVLRWLKGLGTYEYDLVGVNSKVVVVVEIKAKLRQKDVEDFVNKKLPAFRRDFLQNKKHVVMGAVAGLVVKKEVEDFAKAQGFYVLTQKGKNGAEIRNPAKFKARVY